MRVSDYFAELYVAGRFADAGWNVYFPHRDEGFDFIATKPSASGWPLIRPVQVKGKYPTKEKGDKPLYGFVGELTQLHPDMVLAIPYFAVGGDPVCVAYVPFTLIKRRPNGKGFHCRPAVYRRSAPSPRRDFRHYFDEEGLRRLELPDAASGPELEADL